MADTVHIDKTQVRVPIPDWCCDHIQVSFGIRDRDALDKLAAEHPDGTYVDGYLAWREWHPGVDKAVYVQVTLCDDGGPQ